MIEAEINEETVLLIVIWICCSALTIFQGNSDYMVPIAILQILWILMFIARRSE